MIVYIIHVFGWKNAFYYQHCTGERYPFAPNSAYLQLYQKAARNVSNASSNYLFLPSYSITATIAAYHQCCAIVHITCVADTDKLFYSLCRLEKRLFSCALIPPCQSVVVSPPFLMPRPTKGSMFVIENPLELENVWSKFQPGKHCSRAQRNYQQILQPLQRNSKSLTKTCRQTGCCGKYSSTSLQQCVYYDHFLPRKHRLHHIIIIQQVIA